MRNFFIVSLLLTTCLVVQAQRVGIQTQHPQATLHVAGTCRIDSIPIDTSALWMLGITHSHQLVKKIFSQSSTSPFINHDSMVRTRNFFEIEIYERSPKSWFDAVITCYQEGKRLCTLEEWFTAGSDPTLSLVNMTNGWEWLSSTGQGTTFKIVGGSNIYSQSNALTSGVYHFRCCVSP